MNLYWWGLSRSGTSPITVVHLIKSFNFSFYFHYSPLNHHFLTSRINIHTLIDYSNYYRSSFHSALPSILFSAHTPSYLYALSNSILFPTFFYSIPALLPRCHLIVLYCLSAGTIYPSLRVHHAICRGTSCPSPTGNTLVFYYLPSQS